MQRRERGIICNLGRIQRLLPRESDQRCAGPSAEADEEGEQCDHGEQHWGCPNVMSWHNLLAAVLQWQTRAHPVLEYGR